MKATRKEFLRLGGLAVLATAGAALVEPEQNGVSPSAPTAKRWGLAIDFGKCHEGAGCEDCISACRAAHNIPEVPDPARAVKWVWKEQYRKVFPQPSEAFERAGLADHPLPVLCNHCANPACTRVCPTAATWKREDGVVMMDWHRCIGCRYCMAACPYGARSFNWSDPRPNIARQNPAFPTRSKGVVEKCNLCEERLAEGKLPVCVEACREKAMVFGDLNDEQSPIRVLLGARFSIQRLPELGTGPSVFYLV